MRFKLKIWLLGFLGFVWLPGPWLTAEKLEHRKLAEYYAPVVYQEAKSSVLDFITRFDFDGDWNGANNWNNAYLFELPAYVYYAVIESTGHYFITYAFFHARDYSARPMEGYAPKTEHENDLEGCTLVVEKGPGSWGKPILLETLAHDHFFKYKNPDYAGVRGALDGTIVFLGKDGDQYREPAVFIEAEGHGVKGAGREVLSKDFKHPGVIYRFSGRGAETPQNNTAQDVSYELIPIEDTLWVRRAEVGQDLLYCCGDEYALPDGRKAAWGSAFNGPIGSCSAKPPWGWDQADDGPIKKGDWFRDPLSAYEHQFQSIDISGKYLHNPYLLVEPSQKSAVRLCSESTDSKDLNQAITSTLFGIGKVLFSGGMDRKQVGNRARQLFLTDTVLVEWFRKSDFESWEWNKTLSQGLLPSLITENFADLMRIPLGQSFAFSSPTLKAPTRYFDRLVLKYKCSLEGATAKVFWTYDDMTEFDETLSVNLPLRKSEGWVLDKVDFQKAAKWDREKILSRIKVEILSSANETLATVTPEGDGQTTTASGDVVFNHLILDRNAFADTFER